MGTPPIHEDLVSRVSRAPVKFDPQKGWIKEVTEGGVTIYEPTDPPGGGETGETPSSASVSSIVGIPLAVASAALKGLGLVLDRLGKRSK